MSSVMADRTAEGQRAASCAFADIFPFVCDENEAFQDVKAKKIMTKRFPILL